MANPDQVGGFFLKSLEIPHQRNSGSSGSERMVLSPCFKPLSPQNSICIDQSNRADELEGGNFYPDFDPLQD